MKDGKRYRYYVERMRDAENEAPESAAGTALSHVASTTAPSSDRRRRIPAHDIEAAVLKALSDHLRNRDAVCELVGGDAAASMLPERLHRAVELAAVLASGIPQDKLSLLEAVVAKVTILDTGAGDCCAT